MVPTAPPPLVEPAGLRVTVLPDAVVVVVGAGFVVVVFAGAVVRLLVLGRDAGVLLGVDAAGAGAAGVAGTSRNCGWSDVSWLASCRSRLRVESAASVESLLLSFTVHAAAASATHNASGARNRRIYFVMTLLQWVTQARVLLCVGTSHARGR
jgi:hypothetical protein